MLKFTNSITECTSNFQYLSNLASINLQNIKKIT